jgi:hypothetical protein
LAASNKKPSEYKPKKWFDADSIDFEMNPYSEIDYEMKSFQQKAETFLKK